MTMRRQVRRWQPAVEPSPWDRLVGQPERALTVGEAMAGFATSPVRPAAPVAGGRRRLVVLVLVMMAGLVLVRISSGAGSTGPDGAGRSAPAAAPAAWLRSGALVAWPATAPGAPAPVTVAPAADPSGELGRVLFDVDSAFVAESYATLLDETVATLGHDADLVVTAVGHADGSGGADYNLALAERRARAVADELLRRGAPAAAVRVLSRGEFDPVAAGEAAQGREDRRVDLVLSSRSAPPGDPRR